MNTKIDWHYHISGRNIKEDILTLNNYLKDMNEVYVMASYFPLTKSGVSNYNLYYHLKNVKKVKLYLSLDFEYYFYQGYNEIVSLLKEDRNKFIGIKIYTGYQNIDFKSKEFKMVLNLANKYNLYVMFHAGYLKGNKSAFNPIILEDIIYNNSNIKFIVAHLANPYSSELISLLNKYSNIYSDISGLVDKKDEISETKAYVQFIYKNVKDKNKFLFGTDYPIQDYETTLNFIL